MIAIAFLFVCVLCDCFKSRRLEAEILVLRHQLNVLQQRARRRLHLRWADRALFIWLYRRCPRILDAVTIVRPETVVRWHRMGFAAYWRWKSRPRGGRPRIGKEVRDLIRRMSIENPLWGAPKIHGELRTLGIDVAQSTVSMYMVPRQGRPLQTWKIFLRNHGKEIASIDLFVVPTIAFQRLFVFLVLGHRRRQLLWFAVTQNPTAEWLARQITEAFPWDTAPKYLIRDNDRALRHQLTVLRRNVRGRAKLTNNDRWFFVQLYRWFPSVLEVLTIIRPETLVRWHRAGFRRYWHWKSRQRGGRPQVQTELRVLIRRMSIENPLWGAPRIHGELLKLGYQVSQSSVAKYMVKRRGPPSQGWRAFLANHAPHIAAMDLFVVPTIGFDLLYAFVVVRLDRRDLIWISVTRHPTAEWIARQVTEAFPWNEAPRYLIRDRDRIFGAVVTRRLRTLGIRDKPIAPASPWQNGFAERVDRVDPPRVCGPHHCLG